ncbi:hypothetical protein OSB04_016970 [Centaurea solstitialis]|uniref:Uncharacterized protein n=1 Tax=Centaurea solstitialis TaxID=347529 RepID=A0AA38TDY8_9ASTR|nr:hypothetical protein OSB04_016970 [Centaurea solstitialis]
MAVKTNSPFGTAAYVTQDDNLIGTLTVRETISYSARLHAMVDKRALVESTIVEMGLQDCADTLSAIGTCEVLAVVKNGKSQHCPRNLDLDRDCFFLTNQPAVLTAGVLLATKLGLHDVKIPNGLCFGILRDSNLKRSLRDGRTVIASIHQPSSEVFELFDLNILEYLQFFAHVVFLARKLRNPSDHFLRCINSDFDKVKATLKGSMKLRFEASDDPLEKVTTAEAIRALTDYYRTSQYCYAANEKKERCWNRAAVRRVSLCNRLCDETVFRQHVKGLRLVIYVLVTVCIGTIYLNVGTSYNSILARGACASFVFGFVTFMSIGGFPSFVEQYDIRDAIFDSDPFISGTICYFMVRLHPGYALFVLCIVPLCKCNVVESLMMAIASVVPNFSWAHHWGRNSGS